MYFITMYPFSNFNFFRNLKQFWKIVLFSINIYRGNLVFAPIESWDSQLSIGAKNMSVRSVLID